MDARLLTRCTNAVLVAAVGMTAGHLLLPMRAGATPGARATFGALVAGSGMVAAARERAISSEYAGRRLGAAPAWLAGGALTALALGALAWFVVHG